MHLKKCAAVPVNSGLCCHWHKSALHCSPSFLISFFFFFCADNCSVRFCHHIAVLDPKLPFIKQYIRFPFRLVVHFSQHERNFKLDRSNCVIPIAQQRKISLLRLDLWWQTFPGGNSLVHSPVRNYSPHWHPGLNYCSLNRYACSAIAILKIN